jgi:uncharacterized protein YbjT (DUF2867 family)
VSWDKSKSSGHGPKSSTKNIFIAVEDLASARALREAHHGIDVVLMLLPATDDLSVRRFADAAMDAIATAKIHTIIFNAGVQSPRTVAELPQFDVRRALEDRVRASGLKWVVLRPTFLLQNLLLPWVVQAVVSSGMIVYPVHADLRLFWVAAEDIGRMAAQVLKQEHFGETIDLGGECVVDGNGLADAFGEALARKVVFESLPLDQFERGVDAAIGPGAGKRVSSIFRIIQNHPDDLDFVTKPYSPSPRIGSFQPMLIPEWVKRHREIFSHSSANVAGVCGVAFLNCCGR